MSVRRLKAKQQGASCSWCAAKATHRGFGFGKFACDPHLAELTSWDKQAQTPDYSDAAFVGGWHD